MAHNLVPWGTPLALFSAPFCLANLQWRLMLQSRLARGYFFLLLFLSVSISLPARPVPPRRSTSPPQFDVASVPQPSSPTPCASFGCARVAPAILGRHNPSSASPTGVLVSVRPWAVRTSARTPDPNVSFSFFQRYHLKTRRTCRRPLSWRP